MARGNWFGRFDPWREMARLQEELNDLFDSRRFWPDWYRVREYPPLNVWSEGDNVCVAAELPGVRLEDVEITITGDTLTLKGERKPEARDKDCTYLRAEQPSGSFMRTIQLPDRTEADKAEARYANGVLTVRVPKAPEAKPRKIAVKTS